MKTTQNIGIRMKWNGRTGHFTKTFKDVGIIKDRKCDFDLTVNVVESLDGKSYDFFDIKVDDLRVFDKDNNYLITDSNNLRQLTNDIKEKVSW